MRLWTPFHRPCFPKLLSLLDGVSSVLVEIEESLLFIPFQSCCARDCRLEQLINPHANTA